MQCLQGLLSQEAGHLSWHLKRGLIDFVLIQTFRYAVVVLLNRSVCDPTALTPRYIFYVKHLIFDPEHTTLSLLILNTEVNDSFTDYTLWVFTGAVSVELNKLNKWKPNPVFENQPLYKCDNEVKHSALCCESTSIFLQRLPFVHKEQNITLKWSEWFLLLLRILQEYSSLIVMRVRQTELSASQASSQTIKTENDGYFSVWSAAVREIWNRTECLLTSETRFRIVWGSWIQATNVINRLKSDNTDSHPLK